MNEVEPNNSLHTAQNMDGHFTLAFDSNIGDTTSNTSTTIPHVTITGTGDDTFDHYMFTVTKAGAKGIFDIDFGSTGVEVDTYLQLFDSHGALLASNDDSFTSFGQGGSESNIDSYLEFTFDAAGLYVIQVGRCCAGRVNAGSDYQLQVSLENPLIGFTPFTIHQAEIRFDDILSREKVQIKGAYTLASTSGGIDLLSEDVSVRVGTASITIPAGSFIADFPKYTFKGTIEGIDVKMVIEEIALDTFKFRIKAEGVDLTNSTNPLDIVLIIGNHGSRTKITLEGKLKYIVKDGDDHRGKNRED